MDENPTVSTVFEIEPPDPPNDGIMFVDHARSGRSGHLGHALVEYAPGKILAFYPNCSDRNDGHTGGRVDGIPAFRRRGTNLERRRSACLLQGGLRQERWKLRHV